MARLRVTALVLTMAMMLSAGAQCLAAGDMSTGQMACCAGSEHECRDDQALEMACCDAERAEQPQLLDRIHKTSAIAVLPVMTAAFARVPEPRPRAELTATPLPAPSQPKYVLLATFLI
jgi:hypothetical protein